MKRIILLILSLVSLNANALTLYRTDWGLAVHNGNYSVDDPKGSTNSSTSTSFAPVAAFVIGKTSRLWTELNFNSFDLSYGTSKIGQKVKSTELKLLYQNFFYRSSAPVVLYYSLGWSLSKNKYTERALVDVDGFITQQYGNRDVFNSAIDLGVGASYKASDTFTVGLGAHAMNSIDHGINGFMVNLYVLMRGTPAIH